ncbi:MAG: Rrf2 family transcriptional regulator [Acidimicrobiia bacterium]
MQMQFSRTCDYAIRAALVLADGARHKSKDVAEEAGIPPAFAPQVLGHLVRAGIVASTAGQRGGYRLCRQPDEVTLLDLIEAMEGPLKSTRCVLSDASCNASAPCTVHEHWYRAQDVLRGSLTSTTLQMLLGRDLRVKP